MPEAREAVKCKIHKEEHQELWPDQFLCESCFLEASGFEFCIQHKRFKDELIMDEMECPDCFNADFHGEVRNG